MKHNKKFEELGLMDFYGELTAPEKALFDAFEKMSCLSSSAAATRGDAAKNCPGPGVKTYTGIT